MRPIHLLMVAIALASLGATVVGPDRSQRAHALVQDAKRRLALGTFDERRIAMSQLEQALRLMPDDVNLRIDLGQIYLERGLLHVAGRTFERALRRSPGNADALAGLARVSQRDWLDSGDFGTLLQAIRRFEAATRSRARFCEAWTTLAALRLEKGDPDGAFEAAKNALTTTPERVEAQLSAAYLAYRTGHVTLADSLFQVALPRLDARLRARFADISPLMSDIQAEMLASSRPAARAETVRRFWSRNNPDPTDPINLAQLEFWSRLAHATLLLGDPWTPRWARRTAHYARYGRKVQVSSLMGPRHYEMPRIELGEVPDLPTPEALASLGQVTSDEGFAIFAPLPPRVRELPMDSRLASFRGDRVERVVAGLQVPGTPRDSLRAQCVVLDGSEREVARSSQPMSPSACDPSELRAAEFPLELPAGRYRVVLTVKNGDDRAVRRVVHDVTPSRSRLTMSDVVLTCGLPDRSAPRAVRLDMNLSGQVEAAMPLFAYFEIDHLRTDPDGGNRFRYEYAVRGGRRSKRGPPLPSFSTMQEGAGSLRRQFIRVPVGSLAPGSYSLVISVEDLIGGERTEGRTDFVRPRPKD